MTKLHKVLAAAISILLSAMALVLGFWVVGTAEDIAFAMRLACDFVFLLQFAATIWAVIALVRKTRPSARSQKGEAPAPAEEDTSD